MIRNFIRDFTSFLRQFKKIINGIIIVFGMVVLLTIGWNTVKFYRLQTSLQDVYFMEYGDGVTTIHKYDVAQKETFTVIMIKGYYYNCKINRTENYIIGKFRVYEKDTYIMLRYNLSDGTMEELTEMEAEKVEEQIKEKENELPERSSLPEQVRKRASNGFIIWSLEGEKAVFCDSGLNNIYVYDVHMETCKRIIKAGWNHGFQSHVGLDTSANYIFYVEGFRRLFSSNDKVMIYDMKTGMRTKIYEQRDTQNEFEFVQDMN